MDMTYEKVKLVQRAEKSIGESGSAVFVVQGQKFEVTDLSWNDKSCIIGAQIAGGQILFLDASDPFAVIVKG
ncbi:hypothetical protein CG471_11665 [Sphingobium sp. IP1]|uniref:hypothetical protein n=1 Tax=Sphingobium sp. IP1 TaxID=2021637 RepID=UPI000C06933C|nr:hypothetical protein [Sphingobium sp. IP1]PHP19510.1 hypothetical protein CG471_11665 [Sphingobium sp. IP1]